MMSSLFTNLEAADLYGAAIARLSYGMFVISSPDSVDTHSDWDPAVYPIHAVPDSIYVSARQAASGLVAIVCIAGPFRSKSLELLFSGAIELSRATISIYDPGGSMSLQLPVEERTNLVEILGNDSDEPSEILVVLAGVKR